MQHIRAEVDSSAAGFSSSLMFRAARWYYEDKLSQQEIADRLKTHRTTVSRLLQMAKDRGIVRIEVVEPSNVVTLSEELAQVLKLERVVVVEDSATRGSSSAATAEHLVEPALRELAALKLTSGSLMGVSWGNAVWRIASAQTELDLTGVDLVPVVGGMDESDPQYQTNEIVRLLAEHTNANVNFLHLPARLPAKLRSDLCKDPVIGPRLAMWDRLDAALVGIGTTAHDVDMWPRLVRSDREFLADAVGDVAARYFTATGKAVAVPGEDSLVSITRAQLKKTGCVVAVAAGQEKAQSILGAARAGVINVLVTDASTAEAVTVLVQR